MRAPNKSAMLESYDLILRLIYCNFARFNTSARFNRLRSGGGTRLKKSSVCYTQGYVNWSKCLWPTKREMAALGVEVPYILYEGHVPLRFRGIHVPSEKARPNVRVWQLLAGNDKASPLVKFWRKGAWEVCTSQLTPFRVIQYVEFTQCVSVILALFMKQFLRSKQTLFLFHQEQYSVKRNSRFPRFS